MWEVALDGRVVLLGGVVLVAHEQLHDVVHPGPHGRAPLVDLVKVDKGLVQGERAGVDELHDRRAEAVGVADVLEGCLWLDELKVGRCRDYRKLAWCYEGAD